MVLDFHLFSPSPIPRPKAVYDLETARRPTPSSLGMSRLLPLKPISGHRLFKNLILMSILLLGLPALEVSGQEIPKLTIGVILPLTGSQKAYGLEAWRGIQLAHEILKVKDPDLAAHIFLERRDDESKAAVAKQQAEDVIKRQRAHALLGSISSAASYELAKVADQYGKPCIVPTAIGRKLKSYATSFLVTADGLSQGKVLAEFAVNGLKRKRAAILRDETESSSLIAQSFREALTKAGGSLVVEKTFELAATDFKEMLTAIKALSPAVILVPSHYRVSQKILSQAKNIGIGAVFLGTDNWDSHNFTKLAGQAAQGHYFTSQFAVDNQDPDVLAFAKAFKEKFGRDPGAVAALNYDSFMIIADATKRAKSNAAIPLLRALRSVDLTGLTGKIGSDGAGFVKSGIVKTIKGSKSVFYTHLLPKTLLDSPKGH